MDKIEKLKFTSEEVRKDFVANLEWARETSSKLEETFMRCLDSLCRSSADIVDPQQRLRGLGWKRFCP